jgi:hydrogenase-4 membrane subunit HyfE
MVAPSLLIVLYHQRIGFEIQLVAAQMSRGKSEKTLAFAMSSVAATLQSFLCVVHESEF